MVTLTRLFAISMVARSFSDFARRFLTSVLLGLPFIASQSSGVNEKKAISEPEINADKNKAIIAIDKAIMLPVSGTFTVSCCTAGIAKLMFDKKLDKGSGSKILIIS